MKRKLYSVEYVKQLKKEAKRPANVEESAKKILLAMVMFIESKGITDELELFIESKYPEIATLIDEE